MQMNLKPLSFGEILDAAFTLYRRNFLRFAASALLPTAGLLVAAFIIVVSGAAVAIVFGGIMAVVAGALVATAVLAMAMVMWGALTWAASCAYTGRKTTLGECLEAGGRSAMTLVGVFLVALAVVALALLAVLAVLVTIGYLMGTPGPLVGVIAGVAGGLSVLTAMLLVSALFFAALPAVVLEELGPLQAVGRSVRLASGSVWRIAGVLLVTMMIAYLPLIAVGFVTGEFQALYAPEAAAARQDGGMPGQVLSWVANALVAPFMASVMVLLYYDRRVRTEALDVQLATEHLALAGG